MEFEKIVSESLTPVLCHHDSLDSTNDELIRIAKSATKEELNQFRQGYVCSATSQTKGRGQYSRQWVSEPGGLYVSLLIPFSDRYQTVPHQLVTDVGQCAVDLIQDLTGLAVELEYPNDIILDHFKLGGVLIQSIQLHHESWVVIGIGLNINQTVFPDFLRSVATSVAMQTQQQWNLDDIKTQLVNRLLTL